MDFINVFDQLAPIALVARRCPSTTLRRAYVKAFRDWCAETRWLRLDIPGSTVVGAQTYNLGSDPLIQIVAVHAVSLTDNTGPVPQYFPLAPSDSGGWNPNLPQGRPTKYCYLGEAQIAVFQVPNKVYGLTVTANVQPHDDVAQIPEAPLVKYSTGIEAGALMHLLRIPGQPWTDPKMAEKYEAIWNSCVSNGKAEVQRSFNSGSQRAAPRAFVMGR